MLSEIITEQPTVITGLTGAQWTKPQDANIKTIEEADISDSNSLSSDDASMSCFSDIESEIISPIKNKRKAVSFYPSVDVYLTHCGEDYDRASISVDSLTKEDIVFVIEMRRSFEKTSLELYRSRFLSEQQ